MNHSIPIIHSQPIMGLARNIAIWLRSNWEIGSKPVGPTASAVQLQNRSPGTWYSRSGSALNRTIFRYRMKVIGQTRSAPVDRDRDGLRTAVFRRHAWLVQCAAIG